MVLALLALPLKASAKLRIALVIGNGAYSSSPLSDATNDADLMFNTLQKLNFKVTTPYKNVNQKDMKRLIRDFGNQLKARNDSVGVFYYSGHGMQVGGRNYMIPIGANIMDESDISIEGVGVDYILAKMHYAGNAVNFVILDACRDNPFEKSFKSPAKGLGKMIAPEGTLIAFAAQPNKVALQGSGKYSYFTEALAQEMVKPGISAIEMLRAVRVAVLKKTGKKQLPVVEDQMLANFYFNSHMASIQNRELKSQISADESRPEFVIRGRKGGTLYFHEGLFSTKDACRDRVKELKKKSENEFICEELNETWCYSVKEIDESGERKELNCYLTKSICKEQESGWGFFHEWKKNQSKGSYDFSLIPCTRMTLQEAARQGAL
jgi:hypothetical protein